MNVPDLHTAYFVHPDNAAQARSLLGASVAVIARPDDHLVSEGGEQILVETSRGVHTRCYLTSHRGTPFIVVYGRFERTRTPSDEIEFAKTQEALDMLGVQTIVGTFVGGAICSEDRAGAVVIPDNFIGLGGFADDSWATRPEGFRNVEMFAPFCPDTRKALAAGAGKRAYPVHPNGTYVCFHGWPRIETSAELEFYEGLGGKVVGQTLDPEATFARQAGCHYAAIAAMMDDHDVRGVFREDQPRGAELLSANIVKGRQRTFELFLDALPELAQLSNGQCGCDQHRRSKAKRSSHFYYRPAHLIVDEPAV